MNASEGRTVSEVIKNITEWAESTPSIDAAEIARILTSVLDMVDRGLDRAYILSWVDEETAD